jgi:hypothetical protein
LQDRITVGVFALDQVLLPKAGAGRGWAQRLAEMEPALVPGAQPQPLLLSETGEGLVLHGPVELAGATHAPGTRVAVEAVQGRRALFLVRIGGKPVAAAAAGEWQAALAPAEGPVRFDGIAAYVAGTLIDTPDGPRAVESLVAGNVVTTLASGSRPLRWVGRRRVSALEMLACPALRPVEFAAGTVGNGRLLRISAQQRMLIDDWRAEVYFGEDRVLVAAQALVDDRTARVVLPGDGVEYVVLLCDRHEVLLAEGALSESFHPGDLGLSGLTAAERAEVEALVPEAEVKRRRAAFPIVHNAEARALRL